jgi:hypothetical protein
MDIRSLGDKFSKNVIMWLPHDNVPHKLSWVISITCVFVSPVLGHHVMLWELEDANQVSVSCVLGICILVPNGFNTYIVRPCTQWSKLTFTWPHRVTIIFAVKSFGTCYLRMFQIYNSSLSSIDIGFPEAFTLSQQGPWVICVLIKITSSAAQCAGDCGHHCSDSRQWTLGIAWAMRIFWRKLTILP